MILLPACFFSCAFVWLFVFFLGMERNGLLIWGKRDFLNVQFDGFLEAELNIRHELQNKETVSIAIFAPSNRRYFPSLNGYSLLLLPFLVAWTCPPTGHVLLRCFLWQCWDNTLSVQGL